LAAYYGNRQNIQCASEELIRTTDRVKFWEEHSW